MAVMAVLQASLEFGIVQILDVSRYSVYLGYGIPVAWGLCVDSLLYVLFRKAKLLNFCSFAVLTAACVMTAKEGLRSPLFINAYETNGSVICLNNIIRENKEEAWTICSANDERQMLGDYKLGYHYEMIKFIRDMRSLIRHYHHDPDRYGLLFCGKAPASVPGLYQYRKPNGPYPGKGREWRSRNGRESCPISEMTAGLRCHICIIGRRHFRSSTQTRWRSIMSRTILCATV